MDVYMKLLSIFLLLILWSSQSLTDDLSVYFIDVGQADSTLVVTSNGNTLLIDSGQNGSGDEIKALLDSLSISAIDHYLTTHYHSDHYGGIDELISSGISVTHAYDRGDKCCIGDKLTQARYLEYDEAFGNRATHLTRGMAIPLDPAVIVQVLSSGGVVLGEQDPVQTGEDENDMSVTVLVQLGNFKMFVGGDVHTHVEDKIAQLDLVSNIDVYQANHHGSDTSSSQAFMDKTSPSLVVISNGNHGGYKHPRESTLSRYSQLPSPPVVLQVNEYTKGGSGGNVEDEFIADPAPDDETGTIVLQTNTSQGSYSVSYRNQVIPFEIKTRNLVSTELIISSLLPNPVGSDRLHESVTLRNNSNGTVDLAGMVLRDISNRIWSLTGIIGAGEEYVVIRNAMPMNLNNKGDTI